MHTWTIRLPLTSPPGYVLLPYECLEGDYAIKNALSARSGASSVIRPRRGIHYANQLGNGE
jgi:hypothetical protein